MRLSNQWGSFHVSAVEAARLSAIRHCEPMRRAVTLVLSRLGGYVVDAIAGKSRLVDTSGPNRPMRPEKRGES